MIVTILQTGETMEVNASYGSRLIEQGKAKLIQAEKDEAAHVSTRTKNRKNVTKDGAD